MQWLTNLPLGDNRTLQIAVLCVVAIVALVALIIAYRALFGHRLRFSGAGRARQPRLGLVDAFSLDGQRQLVLVRRDNIEHLLMIGGPNDVVVESQIIRAQPQALAPREKDVAIPSAPAAPKQVAPAEAHAVPVKVPAPAISPLRPVTQTGPTAAQTQARALGRAEPTIVPQPRAPQPQPSPAQGQAPPPQPPAPSAAPLAPKPQPPAADSAEGRSAPSAPKPSVLPLRQANPAPARPSPLPPPIVVAPGPTAPPVAAPKPVVIPTPPGSAPKAAPSPPIVPPPPKTAPNPPPAAAPSPSPATAAAPSPPPATAAAPSSAAAAPAAKNDPFAELDSLEAEMARLLGRDP